MRQTTAASIVALGFLAMPVQAQQSVIYGDPITPAQGQTFGNQPIFIDPNTGQPLPQQPQFGQPIPQPPQFGQPQGQPQQPFGQPQPQPGFGQPLPQPGFGQQPPPQPNFGQPLPQPQRTYNPALPQPLAPRQAEPLVQPRAPQPARPYYETDSTEPAEPRTPATASDVESDTPVDLSATQPSIPGDVPAAAAGGDRAPQMSSDLSNLIEVGERYRAASPGFLEDLKALAERYRDPLPASALPAALDPIGLDSDEEDGTELDIALTDPAPTETLDPITGLPVEEPETGANAVFDANGAVIQPVERLDANSIATIVFLEDYFDDGEIEYNPPWRVRQGNWGIDPQYGLRAKAPATASDAPIRPKELLKTLLSGDDTDDAKPASIAPQAALIENQVSIGNAFSFAARITDHDGKGAAHFIMHQGGSDWLGYRLELRSGPQPVVVLTRRGSNGYKDITKVQAPGFTTGETHELRWARLSNGQMLVILNGQPIINSRDTVFREDWKGFAFFNAGGDVSIRAIRIAAPVER